MDAVPPQDVRQERVRSSRVVLSRQCRGQPRGRKPGGTVATKLVRRGDHGAAVTPLRRECRSDFGVPVLASRASFLFARKAVGAFVHPAFPAPSIFGGSGILQSPGEKSRRGNAVARHCEERSDEAIHISIGELAGAMDCFVASAFALRAPAGALLAMTSGCLTNESEAAANSDHLASQAGRG